MGCCHSGMSSVSKAPRCNGCEVVRVDYYARRGLRSSSPLRVVAIQVIDIFIKGCYLQCPDFLSEGICFWLGLKSTISSQAWAYQTAGV